MAGGNVNMNPTNRAREEVDPLNSYARRCQPDGNVRCIKGILDGKNYFTTGFDSIGFNIGAGAAGNAGGRKAWRR